MTIIVDSDGLIGSLNPSDVHYLMSQTILLKLSKKGARLIYPATVIPETVTFLQGKLNSSELANQVVRLVSDNELIIESIDSEILQKAGSLMDFKKSKHHTLFDTVVAAVAQKYKADAIFSFDKFYKSKGFKLATEL